MADADLVVTGTLRTIATVDDARSTAEALAVPGTQTIDVGDGCVLPHRSTGSPASATATPGNCLPTT